MKIHYPFSLLIYCNNTASMIKSLCGKNLKTIHEEKECKIINFTFILKEVNCKICIQKLKIMGLIKK
jgi:hypothetical protein